MAAIAVAVVVLLAVGGWCAYRFLKKKRPKGADTNLVLIGDFVVVFYAKHL